MKLDDIDRWFAFVFIALTFVAGMVALAQGLSRAFGDTVADFAMATGMLAMSIAIALEVRK